MRIIDADEAVRISKDDKLMWVYDLTDLEEFLAGLPTIDPASLVKRGRWKNAAGKRSRFCSLCGYDEPYKFADENAHIYNYCPFCGAKMEDTL